MNTNKAYIFGLLVGGGSFRENKFNILLPFRRWGEDRLQEIANDIFMRVRPIFRDEYQLEVTFRQVPGGWQIYTDRNCPDLILDLENYGLPTTGSLREAASIRILIAAMGGDGTLKGRFVTGMADCIGSVEPSHRRFSPELQTVSFEFKGMNYDLVYQMCRLTKSLGCCPDQILWNHPNQHAGHDPYYEKWRKGFKLRLTLSDYLAQGITAFKFASKATAAGENLDRQTTIEPGVPVCERTNNRISGVKVVHPGERDPRLPEIIRNGHYIHNTHFCAILGCPDAPTTFLTANLRDISSLISPFPLLHVGTVTEVQGRINSSPVMSRCAYREVPCSVSALAASPANFLFRANRNCVNGYPKTLLLQGVAYLFAARSGNLSGKRIRGSFQDHLNDNLAEEVTIALPDRLVPLVVKKGPYAAMVGPFDPRTNSKLITQTGLKYEVREIRYEDL